MIKICAEFDNPLALMSMYYSHVRSHLKYECVERYPRHAVHIYHIKSIQKKNVGRIYVPKVLMVLSDPVCSV